MKSYENSLTTIPGAQAKHLEHWGINMMSMQKTEKTMAELQIDLNMSFEFDKLTESGESLQPLSGPGWAFLFRAFNACASSDCASFCNGLRRAWFAQVCRPEESGKQLLYKQRPASAVDASRGAAALCLSRRQDLSVRTC